MKTRAVARLVAWTSCLLILPCSGCYDVVPDEAAFGPGADTTTAADVGVDAAGDTAAADTATLDTAALDTSAADSAVATPDAGKTVDGGTDTGGKLCTENKDCGVAGQGCAYDECVKGQCVHQITKSPKMASAARLRTSV